MFAGFLFALPRADLLLDLFFHEVNRGVQIALAIFREQVRASHPQPDRAAKLPFGNPHVVVLKRDPRVQDMRIQAIQLVELREHVLLNGVRQRYVVRGEDQLHTDNMQSPAAIFNRQIPDQTSPRMDTDKHGYGTESLHELHEFSRNPKKGIKFELIRVICVKPIPVFIRALVELFSSQPTPLSGSFTKRIARKTINCSICFHRLGDL